MFQLSRVLFLSTLLVLTLFTTSLPQWNQAAGPYGGGVVCLASKNTTIYSGTISGIYSAADGGLVWSNNSSGLPTTFIYSIYSGAPGLFAGTFEGIFRSTDDGASWTSSNNGINTDNVFALTGIDTVVFAGTMNGVFRSEDHRK